MQTPPKVPIALPQIKSSALTTTLAKMAEKFRSQLAMLLSPYLSPLPAPINTSVLSGILKYGPCPLNGVSIMVSLLGIEIAQFLTVVKADCEGADVEVPWLKKLRNKESSGEKPSTLMLNNTKVVLKVNETLAELRASKLSAMR